ncbi:hypothetical protein [Aliiglaciecola sp. LCG003]|uniref:hypothetical protein n=1 Tax=Aliiglaciecola sp. LCG003 TaxID=3053655 RepID=UPI002572950F|nr:hypothetical protein [Aliiglaciecola sp. LCG003]WJG11032.1 hypothetical protein QR722_08405 [Aliiglaciecola sp. LCG003]
MKFKRTATQKNEFSTDKIKHFNWFDKINNAATEVNQHISQPFAKLDNKKQKYSH